MPDQEDTAQQGSHVYAGTPDARQSTAINEPVSRFRPRYRALTDDEKALHDDLKAKAVELEILFAKVKPGRYNSLAVTALEQSMVEDNDDGTFTMPEWLAKEKGLI